MTKPGVRPPAQPAGVPTIASLGGIKRPGAPDGGAVGPSMKAANVANDKDAPQLTVTTLSKKDEIGIQTLLGDYSMKGTNHDRKFYQKVQKIKGHENIKVFLYYWDARDGPEFSGWWFGDEIGGSQVWARANSQSMVPPRVGWKIPWDAARPEPGILLVDPYSGGSRASSSTTNAAAGAAAGAKITPSSGTTAAPGPNLEMAQRAKKAAAQVEELEGSLKQAFTTAKESANSQASEVMLKEIQDTLQQQQTSLVEVQKSLTTDINDARKAGPSAMASVTELSRLSPKVRSLQATLVSELNRVKALAQKAVQSAAAAKKQAETAEQAKKQEEKDSKELQESLPASIELVTAAEDSVESVALLAAPLMADPPDEAGEILRMALGEIEASAQEGQAKITEARKEINVHLQGARKYAAETRKKALAEYSTLQQKLTEAQKKLNPFKSFRKEFAARVEAKKALTEVNEKLSVVELEVEKATMTTSAANQGQMSDDEVNAATEMIKPVQQSIVAAMRTVDQKLQGADGAMKEELEQMKERGNAARKQLETVVGVLRKQREGILTQQMIAQATEEVNRAEETLVKCQEAEMPFLKGLEVLPADESTKAITDSEAFAALSEKTMNQAKASIQKKLGEAKRYNKDVAKNVTDELNELLKRLEAASKKLSQFKEETSQRKMSSLLAEAVDSVTAAEKKVAVFTGVAQIFFSEELEKVTSEALKEACDKSKEVDKEATVACFEARKVLAGKQREAKGGEATAAIAKLQTRLSAANHEVAKLKKAAVSGEKLIKGKEVLSEEDARISQAEAEVKTAEEKASPREDLGEERLSDERMSELVAAIESAQKILKLSNTAIGAQLPGAVPVLKSALEKLKERTKSAQDRLNTVLSKTKSQREKVQCENYIKEGGRKADEVEKSLERMTDAELPFLKGIEVLPLTLATETIKESEAAAAASQVAISQARSYIAAKNLEVKHFSEDVSKPAAGEFAKLTERINAAAAKVSTFRKDTEGRKKTAQVQETSEKISAASAQIKALAEAAAPLSKEEESERIADQEAFAICEKLAALSKDAQSQMDTARASLAVLAKDTKGSEAHKENVQKMTGQLAEVSAEFGKARKAFGEHEQKYNAKRLLGEVSQKMSEAEEYLKNAKEACAPLVEHGGEEFLVQSSTQVLATVLREHIKKKELTAETLFGQIVGVGTDGKVLEEAFLAYLEKLPEALSCDELQFGAERRMAIFKYIDTDQDGFVSQSEFLDIFRRRFHCVKGISVTDVFEVSKSKTVGKLEAGEVVEALADPRMDEVTGMTRLECKSMSTDVTGFVTMMGNQGTTYLEPNLPYTTFTSVMDKKLEEGIKSIRQALSFVKAKEAELLKVGGKSQHAVEARAEMTKSKAAVSSLLTSFDTLKRKAQGAKGEFQKKEQAEKDSRLEAGERKEKQAIMSLVAERMEAMEACVKRLEEAARPLVSVEGAELEAFDAPISALEEAEGLLKEVQEAISETKASVKEQQTKVAKATKGPLLEARRELHKMEMKATSTSTASKATVEKVSAKCKAIVDAKYGQVSAALRADLQSRNLSLDKLFEELAGVGEDRISEQAFCTKVAGLEGLNIKADHMRLICRHIEKGGIGKRTFFGFLEQYYVVVKSIAITSEFDVGKGKTIRKAEIEEVIEVLEGPRTDAKVGLTRLRGKSLTDSTEGWISLRGNQGTDFLQEAEKPFYVCVQSVQLEPDFKGEGQEPLREMKVDEILELLEGPRKASFDTAIRVRGKACTDGSMGWFTVQDKKGTVFAEVDSKFYTCSQSVAMTDNMDIKDCKVIRKLAVGENFTILEGPIEESEVGITRVKAKSTKDDQEGWVTIRGNAGTVYASASSKHYCITREVALQKKFQTEGSDTVRLLAKDEMMQALEDPKEEAAPPEVRVKGKALSDGVVGWFTVKGGNVKKWCPYYKCLKAVPLQDTLAAEGASAVRQLEIGEKAELLEGPTEAGQDLRMRARAEKDGAIGWVTIRDGEGKRFLQSTAA